MPVEDVGQPASPEFDRKIVLKSTENGYELGGAAAQASLTRQLCNNSKVAAAAAVELGIDRDNGGSNLCTSYTNYATMVKTP